MQRQEADCRQYCAHRGWTVEDVLVENDTSAYGKKRRPLYSQLLADMEAHSFDAVVVWHPDRLHRSLAELEHFIDVVERTGVVVASVTAGDYDLSSPEGRLTARIVGSVARKESEDKSRRLRRKAEELAITGKVGGGTRPFGYKTGGMEVDEVEAALVREAARRVLGGERLHAIKTDWTARRIPTVKGGTWSTTAIRSFLTRPRTAGLRSHHGAVVADAVWPALLNRGTWEQICVVLYDPSRRRTPAVRSYLLSNLVMCGACGVRLRARPRASGARAYGCVKLSGGCGGVSGLAQPLEDFVSTRVLAHVDNVDVPTRVGSQRSAQSQAIRELVHQIAVDEKKLEELALAHFDEGIISRASYLKTKDVIDLRLAAARARLATLRGATVLDKHAGRIQQMWPDLSLEDRRSVIRGVTELIELLPVIPERPRDRFDTERVRITFATSALDDTFAHLDRRDEGLDDDGLAGAPPRSSGQGGLRSTVAMSVRRPL